MTFVPFDDLVADDVPLSKTAPFVPFVVRFLLFENLVSLHFCHLSITMTAIAVPVPAWL